LNAHTWEDELLKHRSFQLILLGLILLTMLACGLAQETPEQTPLPIAPVLSTEAVTVLTLPGGETVTMPLTQCSGVHTGGYLDVRARAGAATDPNRAELLVAGINNGAGTYDNMYVSVDLGPTDHLSFSGSTLIAQVQLEADGSGSFKDVLILNGAGSSPKYQMGESYPFSAKWFCKYTQ
jgi:hypothetical protein